MATRSKIKRRAYRQEERHRLHEADRILSGPEDSDPDQWVRQVLVDIGFVLRAAERALDYEVRPIDGAESDANEPLWRQHPLPCRSA